MRLIKFRAWDGKMMIDPVWEWNKLTNHYEHYNDFHEKWMYGLDTKNVVLMQFTGLTDKFGKDIYEGDIVKLFGSDKNVSIVEYGIQDIGHDFQGIGFFTSGQGELPFNIFSGDGIEVIGNIYEHPELLTEEAV